MDAPLLALTSTALPPGASPEAVAADNMRQLASLRWLAVAGQLATVAITGLGLRIPLPFAALLITIAGLALVNLAFAFLPRLRRVTNSWILAALMFDVAALALQLFLTGGADNPFVSLFLVQVVLGAILLEAWSAWVLVAAACAAAAALGVAHMPLRFPRDLPVAVSDLYIVGSWLSFALVSLLLVLFSTRITRNLRARDVYLADLRARTIEEDHLVRLGLFASGAAHELGTPLATLSVILGDWRKMPRLAADPELAQDLADMQGEVGRCKTIVTDLLHAAGQPRGEALGRVAAGPFVDEIVVAWRKHPHAPAPLDYTREPLDEVVLVADPALRQAIWNLLDNAAEASPAGLAMTVTAGDELTIEVVDRGPGLPAAILADPGQPTRSRKGEGHGVGLYLAAGVARQLGGRLAARNHDRGGAVLSLVLPLAGR